MRRALPLLAAIPSALAFPLPAATASALAFPLHAAIAFAATSPSSPGQGSPAPTLAALPPGLYLPVSLSSTLHAGKSAPGTRVTLRTTQRIPLPDRHFLPPGTVVQARITASTPDSLTLEPTSLLYRGVRLPLVASARALATFVAIDSTALPANGSTDRGNPDPANWTTAQLGGGDILRSSGFGPLTNAVTETVGSADPWGTYTLPPSPGTPPRALGPFTPAARGLFGFNPACSLATTSSTLTLSCPGTRAATLRRGDVLLLELTPPQTVGNVQ